ncbi:MAG: class I SAM-dependent methyltransferase [Planctomycetaceae bacterium]
MSFKNALSLARYNWPLYLIAFSGAAFGTFVALNAHVSFAFRCAGTLGALIAIWYAVASFLAFHAMFDRSRLLSGTWIPELLPDPPARCIQISVFLEATTLPLAKVFPNAQVMLLDLFQPDLMTEPAVTRARQSANSTPAIRSSVDSLPVETGWSHATIITLAAHEIRQPAAREQLFHELQRVTANSGSIIVIEHLRNLAAFLAFGPGLFHFYPRREWIRLARNAKLALKSEIDITPFVHVFLFTPDQKNAN